MSILTLLFLTFLTGLFTKLADDFSDKNLASYRPLLFLSGIIYGALISYVIISYPAVAPLWIAAVIGNLLFGRVNQLSHWSAIATMVFMISLFGLSPINIFIVLMFTAVCVFEEWLHDVITVKKLMVFKNKILKAIVEFRPMLEIASFLYSAITGLWSVWLALLLFDFGYVLAGKLIDSI